VLINAEMLTQVLQKANKKFWVGFFLSKAMQPITDKPAESGGIQGE